MKLFENGNTHLEHWIAELERAGNPDLVHLRQTLALGAFVRRELSLEAASELAGVAPEQFARLLAGEATPAPEPLEGQVTARPLVSVIIPVYNEEENLPKLEERLVPVLEQAGSYEIVFVNDGSQDRSVPMIREMHARNPRIKLLAFSRNFGHQAALTAGLQHARGQVVALMDADLQDPPELLHELLEKWREGYQVVYAVRMKRKEGPFKRLAYYSFYRILRSIANTEIALDSGDFCLMDQRVVQELRAMPERNKFLRGLRSWVGFRQIGVAYERPARFAGEAKFTLQKLIKLALDGMLSFSSLPLRLASYVGVATALAGAAYLLYAVIAHFLQQHVPPGWTSLIGIILVLGGVQLVVLGVLGEYLARVYDETKRRPEYVIDESLGIRG